ncbi:sulfotransferase domain-containing protein [Celeribacter litoreus]|uniref:sulfotransferase domain-containing protein n=1 Tax=Celeribacter litoreus TaxID=2876714 RepID=UPI001CCC5244|nr:sulfotransferase domain-containing protein [Celeribacter litoreus]MCA0044097.1 sulfotransferase domain-containing protein [Celeribacter litoreus]
MGQNENASDTNEMHTAFLVIGSMKSGTSSFFDDLAKHPDIFRPATKEPDDLAYDAVLLPAGKKKYLDLFAKASPNQLIGEASTIYTKFPHFENCPERARVVLGEGVKLIFLGRDPLDRLKSHYKHEVQNGKIDRPLSEVLDNWPILFDVSNYDMQLEEWLKVFPREQMLVLRTEEYIENTHDVLNRAAEFLGIPPFDKAILHETGGVRNASASKRQPRGLMRTIMYSDFMQRKLKPLMPNKLRQFLQVLLISKKAQSFDVSLSPEREADLRKMLEGRTLLFREMAAQDCTA